MQLLRIRHAGDNYYARRYDEATARLWTAAPWSGGVETDRLVPIRPGALLAPVEPTKIVCVGRNYTAHAAELGNQIPSEPLLFLKPPSSLIGDGAIISLPPESERVEHEGELGVVVGERLRRVDKEEALRGVYGWTCANDVTARDLQRRDVQFTRGKGFDTFCPCGPWISTDRVDPATIRVRVNDELRQDGRTSQMIFDVGTLLAHISCIMTLEPGDLVLTGTPAGVGPLLDGDEVQIEIEGVGTLRNAVAKPSGP